MTIQQRPPFQIKPSFWLVAGVLGWLFTFTWSGALLIMAVLLISVIVHELGHASAYVAFGKRAAIELNGFGGSTTGYARGGRDLPLKTWQLLLVELAGPTAGMLLAALTFMLSHALPQYTGTPIGFVLESLWTINVILSLANLLPVLPLDGGQIVRTLMKGCFGERAIRWAFLVSAILAGVLAIGVLGFYGQLIWAAMFALLATQNAVAWSSAKKLVEGDLSASLREVFEEALQLLSEKKYDDAERLLKQVCTEAPGGLLDVAAHEQLAELEERRGHYQEAFNLLEPLLPQLSPEALMLYQELAMTLKLYEKVCAVGDGCFREMPSESVALRNALAYAALGKAVPAMGWFEAAWENGLPNAPALLARCEFDAIRNTAEYQHVYRSLDRRKSGPRS